MAAVIIDIDRGDGMSAKRDKGKHSWQLENFGDSCHGHNHQSMKLSAGGQKQGDLPTNTDDSSLRGYMPSLPYPPPRFLFLEILTGRVKGLCFFFSGDTRCICCCL